MCHHFSLTADEHVLSEAFYAATHPGHTSFPFGGFYPLSQVAVVRVDDHGQRELVPLEWGLLPSWWKPSAKSKSRKSFQRQTFNARGETVDTKPSYRSAFKSRRCLMLATQFMEEKKYFHLPDDEPFAFAALWEHWQGDNETVETCTIVTTTPNAEVAAVGHDRMPIVLANDADRALWLDPEIVERGPLDQLIVPSPDGMFQIRVAS